MTFSHPSVLVALPIPDDARLPLPAGNSLEIVNDCSNSPVTTAYTSLSSSCSAEHRLEDTQSRVTPAYVLNM